MYMLGVHARFEYKQNLPELGKLDKLLIHCAVHVIGTCVMYTATPTCTNTVDSYIYILYSLNPSVVNALSLVHNSVIAM